MPWNEVLPMDEKTRFLADVRCGLDSVAGLCRRHGISRKTGYKWIHRYEEAGPAGLADRSCRPKTASELTAPHVVEALLETRKRHPTWGAKKLLAYMARKHTEGIGGSAENLLGTLQDAGYTIELILVDLDVQLAAGRSVSRYMNTGRFVDPQYVLEKVGTRPRETYAALQGHNAVARFRWLDKDYLIPGSSGTQDVQRGQPPNIIEEGSNEEGSSRFLVPEGTEGGGSRGDGGRGDEASERGARRESEPTPGVHPLAPRSDTPPVGSSPAFKRWFGKSKVTTPLGNPKPVYHSGAFLTLPAIRCGTWRAGSRATADRRTGARQPGNMTTSTGEPDPSTTRIPIGFCLAPTPTTTTASRSGGGNMEAARERDRLAGRIEQTGAAIEARRGELEALEVPEAAPDGVRAPTEG